MSVVEDIKRARDCGVVHVGASTLIGPSLSQLAGEFGLAKDASRYQEIEREAALRVMRRVLHRDLTHRAEIMSLDAAGALVDRLLQEVEAPDSRYYSNGIQNEAGSGSWANMTDATFDGGVLILGVERSGCLWVEDED